MLNVTSKLAHRDNPRFSPIVTQRGDKLWAPGYHLVETGTMLHNWDHLSRLFQWDSQVLGVPKHPTFADAPPPALSRHIGHQIAGEHVHAVNVNARSSG